jgi:rhodanese-related sulfurtransferase
MYGFYSATGLIQFFVDCVWLVPSSYGVKGRNFLMKTAKDYLEEAHAIVPNISTEEGIAKHKSGNSVFVDVRDSGDIAASGTIAGAQLITRGMIEFRADDTHPLHNPSLMKDADIVLVCGAGGQAALCGKTLKDMGFLKVSNVGGFSSWKEAGGPVQK